MKKSKKIEKRKGVIFTLTEKMVNFKLIRPSSESMMKKVKEGTHESMVQYKPKSERLN